MVQVSIEKKENRFAQDMLGSSDRLLLDNIRKFVDEEIMPQRRELDQSARSDFKLADELYGKILPLGLQGGFLPEEHGGMGLTSALTTALLAEELGRGDASLFCRLAGGMLALRPAVRAENKTVLERFAPGFVSEDKANLGCFAVTEPDAGSDIENPDMMGSGITTSAKLTGGSWELKGSKVWSVNAGVADAYCVVCSTDTSQGDKGIALIYMEAPTDGFRFLGFQGKDGLLGCRQGAFELEKVRVPEAWRAAGPGKDAELLRDNMAFARIITGALATGLAQGTLDEVLDFTSERIAAGKPIRQHTICASILADIAIGIQVGRDAYANAAHIYDQSGTHDEGSSGHMLARASTAKVFCCDAAIHATNRAMELMGSYGYVTDYHVEKYWRDAKTLQLWEGGAHLARLDVARGYYDFDQFHRNELYEHIRENVARSS
jgi:alkylation response protein AidB-like acyl-CoA dehydrogenase